MAVSGLIQPNLSGSYANIQEALAQGANIASKTTGLAGMTAAGIAPISDEVQQRRTELFKATLEDHLNQNKANYAAQAEGKTLTTPDNAAAFASSMGLDPDEMKGLVPKEGVWQTPGEKLDIAQQLKRQDAVEQMAAAKEAKGDQTGANLMRLFGRSKGPEADQMIGRINGLAQVDRVIDPVTKLPQYIDHYTKLPIAGMAGTTAPGPLPGGVDDINSLKRIDLNEANTLLKESSDIRKDPQLKDIAKSLDELKSTRDLIDKNIPGTQVNIGADAARAIGGVPGGRFTALMAMGEGKDPSFIGKLGQGYQTFTTGKMSKNNQNLLDQEVDTAMTVKRKELADALDAHVTRLKGDAPHASDNLISDQIGYQRYLQPSMPATPARQSYKSADDVVAAYKAGSLDRATAKQILQDRFGAK